jgi:hypothetical protein
MKFMAGGARPLDPALNHMVNALTAAHSLGPLHALRPMP